MKDDYKKHLFVPPRDNTIDTWADIVDEKVSNILGTKKSPSKVVKKLRDGMILYQLGRR